MPGGSDFQSGSFLGSPHLWGFTQHCQQGQGVQNIITPCQGDRDRTAITFPLQANHGTAHACGCPLSERYPLSRPQRHRRPWRGHEHQSQTHEKDYSLLLALEGGRWSVRCHICARIGIITQGCGDSKWKGIGHNCELCNSEQR